MRKNCEKRPRTLLVVAGALLALSPCAQAGSAPGQVGSTGLVLEQESKLERIQTRIEVGSILLMGQKGSIRSLAIGAGIDWSVLPQLELGLLMNQSMQVQSINSSLFTEVSFLGSFALTGDFIRKQKQILLSGTNVVQFDPHYAGGWRLSGYLSQYFINGSGAAIPFSGMGGEVSYEVPTHSWWTFSPALRLDKIYNGGLNLSILRGTLRLLIFF